MAGKMGELGDKILTVGASKAKHLYTGFWHGTEYESGPGKSSHRLSKNYMPAIGKPNAKTFRSGSVMTMTDKASLDENWVPADNHNYLHVKGCFHNTVFDHNSRLST